MMKYRTYIPTTLIVMVCVFLLSGYAQTRPQQTRQQAWEYKVLSYIRTNQGSVLSEDGKTMPVPASMLPHLNELGAQGWEMVTVMQVNDIYGAVDATYRNYYFKRSK